uniref:Uncharacterized protein n=1 Tax=Anguilla anguilla TaxID=7936 RepID=A0A0E9XE25_ANGAN
MKTIFLHIKEIKPLYIFQYCFNWTTFCIPIYLQCKVVHDFVCKLTCVCIPHLNIYFKSKYVLTCMYPSLCIVSLTP